MIFMLMLLAFGIANATPCLDGWQSPSTGSGTCSHHGGIDHSKDVNVPYWYTPAPTYTPPATTTDESTVQVANICGEEVTMVNYYENHVFKAIILLGEDKDIARFVHIYHALGTPFCTESFVSWNIVSEKKNSAFDFSKTFSNNIEVRFYYDLAKHKVAIIIQ